MSGPVVGHIKPDPQALALSDLAMDVWGPAGPAGRVVGHVSPWTKLQRDDEPTAASGAVSHRAAMGPRHEGTNPKEK